MILKCVKISCRIATGKLNIVEVDVWRQRKQANKSRSNLQAYNMQRFTIAAVNVHSELHKYFVTLFYHAHAMRQRGTSRRLMSVRLS